MTSITEKIIFGIFIVVLIAAVIPAFLSLCVLAGWSMVWILEIAFEFMEGVGSSLPWPE